MFMICFSQYLFCRHLSLLIHLFSNLAQCSVFSCKVQWLDDFKSCTGRIKARITTRREGVLHQEIIRSRAEVHPKFWKARAVFFPEAWSQHKKKISFFEVNFRHSEHESYMLCLCVKISLQSLSLWPSGEPNLS